MNRLSEIIASKRRRAEAAKQTLPPRAMLAMAENARAGAHSHALWAALNAPERTNIIAECKRRSPSKGAINGDADPVMLAKAYESGGAIGISVLTEEDYFGGSLNDLRAVRNATALPILRKDFIFDEYQIYETAAVGADALLLIVAALDDEALVRLRILTEEELGMDALVEVHTERELGRAVDAGAKLVGVNNRDLRTFDVSLGTSIHLAPLVPNDVVLISESGIRSPSDISQLRDLGYSGFLIGETLMCATDPPALIQRWVKESSP